MFRNQTTRAIRIAIKLLAIVGISNICIVQAAQELTDLNSKYPIGSKVQIGGGMNPQTVTVTGITDDFKIMCQIEGATQPQAYSMEDVRPIPELHDRCLVRDKSPLHGMHGIVTNVEGPKVILQIQGRQQDPNTVVRDLFSERDVEVLKKIDAPIAPAAQNERTTISEERKARYAEKLRVQEELNNKKHPDGLTPEDIAKVPVGAKVKVWYQGKAKKAYPATLVSKKDGVYKVEWPRHLGKFYTTRWYTIVPIFREDEIDEYVMNKRPIVEIPKDDSGPRSKLKQSYQRRYCRGDKVTVITPDGCRDITGSFYAYEEEDVNWTDPEDYAHDARCIIVEHGDPNIINGVAMPIPGIRKIRNIPLGFVVPGLRYDPVQEFRALTRPKTTIGNIE